MDIYMKESGVNVIFYFPFMYGYFDILVCVHSSSAIFLLMRESCYL